MSCTAESWINGTLGEAVEMLSKRASVARVLRKKADVSAAIQDGLTKLKNDGMSKIGPSLSALQRQMELNPAIASGLGGAALGAGVGGLSAMFGNKDTNVLRSAATGAAGGGAAGVGAYMASRMIPQLSGQSKAEADGLNFMHNGRPMSIDMEKIKKNPAVISEIDSLSQRSWPSQIVGNSWDAVSGYAKNHPLLATVMGGDIASHTLGTAAGYASGLPGMRSNVFMEGVRRLKTDGTESLKNLPDNLKELFQQMHQSGPGKIEEFLQKARRVGARGVIDIGGHQIPTQTINEIYNRGAGAGGIRAGGMQSVQDLVDAIRGMGKPGKSPGTPGSRTKFTGMPPLNTPAGAGWGGGQSKIKDILRGASTSRGSTSALGKLLPRLALYAGVPLLQSYAGIASRESRNNKRLDDLVKQLGVPAGA